MNKKLTIYLSIFLLSSCATMFNGTTKNIHMMTSNGDSVKADITSKGGTQTITLPGSVTVQKGNDISVNVKEDKCHRSSSYVINKNLDIFFLGMHLIIGLEQAQIYLMALCGHTMIM